MKKSVKRFLSTILALTMLCSCMVVMNVSTYAADTTVYNLADYVGSNTEYNANDDVISGDNYSITLTATGKQTVKTISSDVITAIDATGSSSTTGNTVTDLTSFTTYLMASSNGNAVTVSNKDTAYSAVIGIYYAISDGNGYASGKLKGDALLVNDTAISTAPSTTYGTINYYETTVNANGSVKFGPNSSRRLDLFAITVTPITTVSDGVVTISSNSETAGTVTVTNNGAEVSSGDTVKAGTELTVTATANEGYQLASLKVNGSAVENGSTFSVNDAQTVYAVFNAERTAVTGAITLDADTNSGNALEYGSELTDAYSFTLESGAEFSSTSHIKVSGSSGIVFNTGDYSDKTLTMVVTYSAGGDDSKGRTLKITAGDDTTAYTDSDYLSTSANDTKTVTLDLTANTEYTVESNGSNVFIYSIVITATDAGSTTTEYAYFGITKEEQADNSSFYIAEEEGQTPLGEGTTVYEAVAYEGDDNNVLTVNELIDEGIIDEDSAYVVAFLVNLSSGNDIGNLGIYFE